MRWRPVGCRCSGTSSAGRAGGRRVGVGEFGFGRINGLSRMQSLSGSTHLAISVLAFVGLPARRRHRLDARGPIISGIVGAGPPCRRPRVGEREAKGRPGVRNSSELLDTSVSDTQDRTQGGVCNRSTHGRIGGEVACRQRRRRRHSDVMAVQIPVVKLS